MTENDDNSIQLQLNLDDPTTKDILLSENIQLHKQIALLQSEIKRLNQMLRFWCKNLIYDNIVSNERMEWGIYYGTRSKFVQMECITNRKLSY